MSKLRLAKQIPFNVLVKRIIKRIAPQKKIQYSSKEFRYVHSNFKLNQFIDSSKLKPETSKEIIQHYLKHEFDLLGSGWVSRNFGVKASVPSTHQKVTDEIAGLIQADYQKINWQKDVKTGHEYDITQPFYKQNTPKGTDIKDLWELGRLQHLPQLALADKKEEFRNQCLDFIAYNPIGMGVQWACTMDVGIRVCNMLVAYDILNHDFDEAFQQVFIDSVYQHGQFISHHLEDKEGAAGNHYLFNLVGLLFVGYYLKIGKWKKLAKEELIKEVGKQFFKDGGNFEGSTTYHCLSAEAVLYGTALMLRDDELSNEYADKVNKIAQFIKVVSKPNGTNPQFGDNDSGRLFKFGNEDDNLLNYQSLMSAFSGICSFDAEDNISRYIVEQIANHNKLQATEETAHHFLSKNMSISMRPYQKESIIKYGDKVDVNKLNYYAFPEFGIYIYKSTDFYLAISAIANENMHHSWGHVHNDKLSFELNVNGQDLVKDVGSYLYTSDAEARNEFRSTKAHHSILVEGVEQNKMIDLFYLERETKCELLTFDGEEKIIELKASYYGVEHIRKFEIKEDKLVITDSCNKPFKVNINQFKEYSPNYGVKQ